MRLILIIITAVTFSTSATAQDVGELTTQAVKLAVAVKTGDFDTFREAGFPEIKSSVDADGALASDRSSITPFSLSPEEVGELLGGCAVQQVDVEEGFLRIHWGCPEIADWLLSSEDHDGNNECFDKGYYLTALYDFETPFLRMLHKNDWNSERCGGDPEVTPPLQVGGH